MALYSDAFTNTDATVLSTHNANWVNAFNDAWSINTNAAYKAANSNNLGGYRWNQNTDSNDVFSEGTAVAVGAGVYIGVACRMSGTSGANSTGYWFLATTTDSALFLLNNGVDTELATAGGISAGNVVRIEANGTTIRCLVNGAQTMSVTNAVVASGQSGICGYGSNTNTRIDTWSGGDLGGGGGSTPPRNLLLLGAG